MGIIKKDFKFKLIKNFLTEEEKNLCYYYSIFKHRTNINSFDNRQSDTQDTFFYADPLTESLLLNKVSLMEKETGLKLYPTYSFWRMYTKFSDLKKHTDRESCEISVTVHMGADNTKWPIFMEGTGIEMEHGDAVIYLGMELEHWREEFQGDFHAQCFLHYVDANGPYKEFIKDKRRGFGYPNEI